MSYCPQCHTEYQSGVTDCADCNVPLVEGTPRFCPNCEEFVTEADTFCNNCGILQEIIPAEDVPECENHPDEPAVGGCVICGKPVCADCATEQNGRIFCEQDEHLNVHSGFVVAYTTATDYEAEMIKANLEGAGIHALVFNQHDHVYFTTMGMLALVNVMVPPSQLEAALEIIGALMSEQQDENEAGDEEEGGATA
ncbi:MAG: DUF2007 domain-containing protein [Bacteroidia bacterium]|nr:DUF2007 domain-containing protein [Bacteroidia bacterium]